MSRKTKYINRKRIRNKTSKNWVGVGAGQGQEEAYEDENVETKEGLFDIIDTKLASYKNSALEFAKEKALRLFGLQTIPKEGQNNVPDASGILHTIKTDVTDVLNKGTAAVISNINDVLRSPEIGETVSQTAAETSAIGAQLLNNFNEGLNTPEMKYAVKQSLDNAAEYTNIFVDSMNEPLNKAVDELNAAGTKAASGAIAGVVKVGTDALAAVPGVGAVIEIGKIANDASKAVGEVVEATSEAAKTISTVVDETSKNINRAIDEANEKAKLLDAKKREATEIMNRTKRSLNAFTKPMPSVPSVQPMPSVQLMQPIQSIQPVQPTNKGILRVEDQQHEGQYRGGQQRLKTKRHRGGNMKTKRVRFNLYSPADGPGAIM